MEDLSFPYSFLLSQYRITKIGKALVGFMQS